MRTWYGSRVILAWTAHSKVNRRGEWTITEGPTAEDYYQAIGRLVVQFEHATESMRIWIMDAAHLFNYVPLQFTARTFMHRMTAREIGEVLRALLAGFRFPPINKEEETVTLSENDLRVVKNISDRWLALCERRNEAVHSAWFIGWSGEKNGVVAPGYRRNKQGLAADARYRTIDEFRETGEQAKEFTHLIQVLRSLFVVRLMHFKGPEGFDHFFPADIPFDDDGNVQIPKNIKGGGSPP